MQTLLHVGWRCYEVALAEEAALAGAARPARRALDPEDALAVLRRALGLAPGQATLRRIAEAVLPGTGPRLEDDAVLRLIAAQLRSGRILVRERPGAPLGGVDGPDVASAPPPRPAEEARRARVEVTWIEIQLLGEDDQPIPGERYRIELPDGSVREGQLDDRGLARVDGIDPGSCVVTFPRLDEEAWAPR